MMLNADAHLKAEVHWVALKRLPWDLHDGTRVVFGEGDLIPLEETVGLRGHIIDRLVEAGKIAPVSVPGDEWVAQEWERRGMGGQAGGSGAEAAAPVTAHSDPGDEDDDEDDEDLVAASTDPEAFPRQVAGQTFELSDGSTIRGRRAAVAAQAELLGR